MTADENSLAGCQCASVALTTCATRDDIDAELRLLVAVRQSIREQSDDPSSCQISELLDERVGAHVG